MLLLAASVAEIFAGLKQSRDPQLLEGAAPKRQQRAELLSPYTTGMPAQPFTMGWYFRHTSISANSPAAEHNGGLKQTVQRAGRRKGLPSPAQRLGTDWFCGWAGILFICFFVLLTWQTALSLGLHRSFQVLKLLNLCSLYSHTEVANKRSRDHFASIKELNKAQSSKTKSTDTHQCVTYLGNEAFSFTSSPT